MRTLVLAGSLIVAAALAGGCDKASEAGSFVKSASVYTDFAAALRKADGTFATITPDTEPFLATLPKELNYLLGRSAP